MRIISTGTLTRWAERREPATVQAIRTWIATVRAATWEKPTDVKEAYSTVSILEDGRAVFNIRGNRFRLVVWINYQFHTVYVRWIGSHEEYDDIDAQEV